MSAPEAFKLVLFAAALLLIPVAIDRIFGRETFVAIVGVLGLIGMLLVLLGVVGAPEIGRWVY